MCVDEADWAKHWIVNEVALMSISSSTEHNHRMNLEGQRFFITKRLQKIEFICKYFWINKLSSKFVTSNFEEIKCRIKGFIVDTSLLFNTINENIS